VRIQAIQAMIQVSDAALHYKRAESENVDIEKILLRLLDIGSSVHRTLVSGSALKIPPINFHARYYRAVKLSAFDFPDEQRFERLKYFALSIPDFSGGRMREAGKLVDGFSSRKTTNPPAANVGPPYQEGAFKADIIIEFNGHAKLPGAIERSRDQRQSPRSGCRVLGRLGQ
jgi:hypothetical protein